MVRKIVKTEHNNITLAFPTFTKRLIIRSRHHKRYKSNHNFLHYIYIFSIHFYPHPLFEFAWLSILIYVLQSHKDVSLTCLKLTSCLETISYWLRAVLGIIKISTLLFLACPFAVWLDAIGLNSPYPFALNH